MKAVLFDKIGPPEEVLTLRDVPIPSIGEDDVLVRMTAASISPGDFLFIEARYPEPKRPKLPGQIAGNHGVGIVEATGANVSLQKGTSVAFSYYGSWAEYVSVPAQWLMTLPGDYPVAAAAQFFNLITAWDVLASSEVRKNDWLLVTAANSAVGSMILQFAVLRNIKVVAIVRDIRNVDFQALGASAVIATSRLDGSIGEEVMRITGRRGADGLVDSVGGLQGGELMRSLAFGSRVILYGGMSGERFALHNDDVLLKKLTIAAYHYRYLLDPPVPADLTMIEEIIAITRQPSFYVDTGIECRLCDYAAAVRSSRSAPEQGKRFFHMPD